MCLTENGSAIRLAYDSGNMIKCVPAHEASLYCMIGHKGANIAELFEAVLSPGEATLLLQSAGQANISTSDSKCNSPQWHFALPQ